MQTSTKRISDHSVAASRTRIATSDEKAAANHITKMSIGETGSQQPVTADMPVQRPNEAPCVVQLFSGMTFVDFSQHLFSYNPTCQGPWAKIVLEGDFNVTAGRQFDRTASFWIGGTNVYFGTTAEPRRTVSPSWHIERDVTDLSAIFANASQGQAVLGNIVNGTYTGVISASAKLEFYPASQQYPAANSPDAVFALSGGPLGDNQYIHNPQQPLTGTFSFPRNIERAYLDVYLQSQIGDEFWYTCFPSDIAGQLFNCGNTAFREGEVQIDGQPAGVVPVYPWIYTGGIDPYFWRPIPAVETFDFVPYRVNLTPFAALLDDGNQHTVNVYVFNNGDYFAANGALLVYLDHGSSVVTGGISNNTTPADPNQVVDNGVTINSSGTGRGAVTTTATHPVSITGFVDTSHGHVVTSISQQIQFKNSQQIYVTGDGNTFDQNLQQTTIIGSSESVTDSNGTTTAQAQKRWPLTLNYKFNVNPDGSASQVASVSQGKIEMMRISSPSANYNTSLSNQVSSADTLTFFATGGYAPSNGQTTQTFKYFDSRGICYGKSITAVLYSLTSTSAVGCH